jgi:hypothetical protein
MDPRGNSLVPVCHARPHYRLLPQVEREVLSRTAMAGSQAWHGADRRFSLSSLVGATMHTGYYQRFGVTVGTTHGHR